MPKNYKTPKNDLVSLVKWARDNDMIIYATAINARVHRKFGEAIINKPTLYRALKRAKYIFEKEEKERIKNATLKQ